MKRVPRVGGKILLYFPTVFLASAMWASNPPGGVDLPDVEELPVVEELPNPFRFNDGTLVETPEDWEQRREEIKQMILYYEYGRMPPAPDNLEVRETSSRRLYGGTATEKVLTFSMGPGRKVVFRGRIVVPAGKGPFPVLAQNTPEIGHIPIEKELLERGYMIAEYVRTDLDPDRPGVVGCAQAAYPQWDWATLAVWAWGGMRLVDYLLTLDVVDRSKIAMTGHSRGGKTALLAGALDERIALVAPNGSGCGGAGCYRVEGKGVETLEAITDPKRFAYWFHPRFRRFAGKEDRLPFDQHFLKALVAPRLLLTTDALEDRWANPLGTQATFLAAQPVFDFLGVSDHNGIHFREGKHDHLPEDWRALADFADLHFFGKKVSRSFRKLPFPDAEKAFSWGAPTLKGSR